MSQQDDWSLTEWRRPGGAEVWYFRKNLHPAVAPGSEAHGFVGFITIEYGSTRSDGMPDDEAFTLLESIEEDARHLLEDVAGAVLVAAVLKPGVRDLIYYVGSAEQFAQATSALQDKYPTEGIDAESHPDADWGQYHELP
jgi:hypothetical protein